jgi:hypothetical protein
VKKEPACYFRSGITSLAIISLSLFLVGFSNNKFDGEGRATITPQKITILREGEYRIKFIVGEHGIKVGGGSKPASLNSGILKLKIPPKIIFLK